MSDSTTTRKVPYERLPYPIGLCWVRAHRSESLQIVDKAAETVVRAMFAMVLADVMDQPWPERMQAALGPESNGLAKASFGACVDLLRMAVTVHASAPDRVLPDLQTWWAKANETIGNIVQERNRAVHDGRVTVDTPQNAKARLAGFIRESNWLQSVQLVYVERSVRRASRDGKYNGRVVRLAGAKPFDEPRNLLEVSWSAELEEGHVYLGRADATLWTVDPFVHVTEHRAIPVLTAIEKRGQLLLVDPAQLHDEVPTRISGLPVPDDGWELAPWPKFLLDREASAQQWRVSQDARFDKLKLPMPPDQRLAPGTRIGDFRLVQMLGQGGFATVWEAEDMVTGEVAALKVLLPAAVENEQSARRFEAEAKQLRRLWAEKCRHILGPVDGRREVFGDELRLVLKMPLLSGTVADHASERKLAEDPIRENEIVAWAIQCLQGLADIHFRGVIHRDIKPSNLLLDAQGQIAIADFGVARDETRELDMTMTGDVLGSEKYMAPEQRSRAQVVTGKADVFSLACTLHELLTGIHSPFAGKGVPGRLGEVLRRMGAQDPDDRPVATEALAEFDVIAGMMVVSGVAVPDATALPAQSVVPTVPQPHPVSEAAPASATDQPLDNTTSESLPNQGNAAASAAPEPAVPEKRIAENDFVQCKSMAVGAKVANAPQEDSTSSSLGVDAGPGDRSAVTSRPNLLGRSSLTAKAELLRAPDPPELLDVEHVKPQGPRGALGSDDATASDPATNVRSSSHVPALGVTVLAVIAFVAIAWQWAERTDVLELGAGTTLTDSELAPVELAVERAVDLRRNGHLKEGLEFLSTYNIRRPNNQQIQVALAAMQSAAASNDKLDLAEALLAEHPSEAWQAAEDVRTQLAADDPLAVKADRILGAAQAGLPPATSAPNLRATLAGILGSQRPEPAQPLDVNEEPRIEKLTEQPATVRSELYERALQLQKKGLYDAAIANYKRAIDAGDKRAHKGLAMVYRLRHDDGNCALNAKWYLEWNPNGRDQESMRALLSKCSH